MVFELLKIELKILSLTMFKVSFRSDTSLNNLLFNS